MKKVMFTIVFGVLSTGLMAQVAFKDIRMDEAYKNYLQLKDALVASNANAAKQAAGKLKTSLTSLKGSKNAIADAAKITNANDLDKIRKTFASLSTAMAAMVKGGQLSHGMLYLEYCPMANNNAGAYWLANEKEIKNPYFGDKMLKCGSVKEMIH